MDTLPRTPHRLPSGGRGRWAGASAGRYYHNVDLQGLVKFLAGMEAQKAILGAEAPTDRQAGRQREGLEIKIRRVWN